MSADKHVHVDISKGPPYTVKPGPPPGRDKRAYQKTVNINITPGTASLFQAISSVAAEADRMAISEAAPAFTALSDAELFVYASANELIGPRMKLMGISEPTLKALAGYERERRKGLHESRSRQTERLWWIFGIVAAAGLAAFFTWLAR